MVATDADVTTVTFQREDSFLEFVVDTVKDLSFSFLPLDWRSSPVDTTAAYRLILLAVSDDDNRSLLMYLSTGNNDDNKAQNQLIVERRLQTNVDRLNVSLSGALVIMSFRSA